MPVWWPLGNRCGLAPRRQALQADEHRVEEQYWHADDDCPAQNRLLEVLLKAPREAARRVDVAKADAEDMQPLGQLVELGWEPRVEGGGDRDEDLHERDANLELGHQAHLLEGRVQPPEQRP